MGDLQPIDLIAAVVLGIAGLRGLFNGLIRELFSLAGLAAAVVAVRLWNEPAAAWLVGSGDGRIGPTAAPWVAGALLAVAAVAAVGIAGRIAGRGARAVGLGWADRAGGAVLGVAEGALVVAVVVLGIGGALGREHDVLAQSRSLAALERIEHLAGAGLDARRDVASPPPG